MVLFYAFKRKVLEVLPPHVLKRFISEFFEYLSSQNPALIGLIKEKKEFTTDIKAELDRMLVAYFKILKEEEAKKGQK
jgi:F0F1-type ATP synthase alpha subunit